jgi:biopolymer transport protein ExbD
MTPLIDTALTLLIIFMITTPIIQNAIRVSLPKGQMREDEGGKQELIVYIDKEKRFFFNGQEQTQEKLVKLIKERIELDRGATGQAAGMEKKVYVKADQEVSYGQVIELVDRLKVVSGVAQVILATQRLA